MRKYELVCVIQPDLDETAFNVVLDKVKGKMAYIIKKHREGQFVLLNMTLNPSAASDLERNLRYQEPIIRHMLSVAG